MSSSHVKWMARILAATSHGVWHWLLLTTLAGSLAGCTATPNDHLITDSWLTPAPRQYKTADSTKRYSASCATDGDWTPSTDTDDIAKVPSGSEALHSPGDLVQIIVSEGAEFSGNYVINLDGTLVLPFAGPVHAAGLSTSDLQAVVRRKLTSSGMLRERDIRVAVLPMQWAPIQVSINGAVYQPGTDYINEPNDKPPPTLLVKTGDSPLGRFLREAFRLGAGVRPDADLSRVTLHRQNRTYRIDLSGVINGQPVPVIPLMWGDTISVPSSGCFHQALFRPSQLTPPGIRVFMSNLTQPATSNTQAAIGQFSSSLPYGTRLLEASVSANCVGGTVSANADRRVVLISRNTLDRKAEIIERTISELMEKADNPDIDPYMMPNDAIACYDSEFTNARDVAKGITDILTAVTLIRLL
jgi:polysaccharide biosynthesis/export protein